MRRETVSLRVATEVFEQLVATQEDSVVAPRAAVVRKIVEGRMQMDAVVGVRPEVTHLAALLEDREALHAPRAQRRTGAEPAEAGADHQGVEVDAHRFFS